MKFPNYNILANIPITNLVGTATDPIDLDSLVDIGTYKISGDVTSADWALVTAVDDLILGWDTYLTILYYWGAVQVYALFVPNSYILRAYSWGRGTISTYSYIQDDWVWNVTISWNLSVATISKPTLNGSVQWVTADTDWATITFDMAASDMHTVTLWGNRTLALSNVSTGQIFTLRLQQDGTGSRTVTWFTTIKRAWGAAPTLTTTLNKADMFIFVCTWTNTYDWFIVWQNI